MLLFIHLYTFLWANYNLRKLKSIFQTHALQNHTLTGRVRKKTTPIRTGLSCFQIMDSSISCEQNIQMYLTFYLKYSTRHESRQWDPLLKNEISDVRPYMRHLQ